MPEEDFEEKADRIGSANIPSAYTLEKIIETLQLFTDEAFKVLGGDERKLKIAPSDNFLLAVHSSFIGFTQQRHGRLDIKEIGMITNSLFLLGRMSVEYPEVLEGVRATLAKKWGTIKSESIRKAMEQMSKDKSESSTLVDAIAEALGVKGGRVNTVSSLAELITLLDKKLENLGPDTIDLPDMKGDPHAN